MQCNGSSKKLSLKAIREASYSRVYEDVLSSETDRRQQSLPLGPLTCAIGKTRK